MAATIFSSNQIEQFIEEGYTMLRGAFPRRVAEAVHRLVVQKVGADRDDPATWTKPFAHLAEIYADEPFASALTPRLKDALDELLGAGRWELPEGLGWWPVIFPGFEKGPWRPPTSGWHVDGIHFHHHLDSSDQALLPIFLFNDMGPGDGGTCISVGSHKITARLLRDAEPAGLSANELAERVNAADRKQVVEVSGQAGDVALMHPFMLHTRGVNVGKSIRVICNPCVRFHEKMNVYADPTRPCSAVERAIRVGLSLERQPFTLGTKIGTE